MKKIIIIVFIMIVGCALFRSPEKQAQINEEQAQINREERRIADCIKTIKIIEEVNNKKPYELIQPITYTIRNGNDEYSFDYLKRQVCEKKGDALLLTNMQVGIWNTTYTVKIITWVK